MEPTQTTESNPEEIKLVTEISQGRINICKEGDSIYLILESDQSGPQDPPPEE